MTQRLAVTSVALTVGAEAADVINVAGQVYVEQGREATEPVALGWYFASDAAGLNPLAVAHDGGVAIGTDGALIENVANLSGTIVTEADGDFDLDIEDAGAFTAYLVIVLPDGSLTVSDEITHAA